MFESRERRYGYDRLVGILSEPVLLLPLKVLIISLTSSGIWLTKSLLKRQLGAILGFCFTSAYLALKYFRKKQAVTVPFQDNSLNSP